MSTDRNELIELCVQDSESNQRIDKVLSARGLGYSRSVIQRWIEEGRVLLDGEIVACKSKVRAGQQVEIEPAPPPSVDLKPQDIPLRIVFEDDALLVLDKPAGLVVHPAPGHADGTLVNALLFHWNSDQGMKGIRPGIVHRLDKDTSGVMVVAKNPRVHELLVLLFSQHHIDRAYHAVVVGKPPAKHRIESFYGRHPIHRKRFTSKVTSGKIAVTELRRLEQLHASALVRCELHTGRTHQIRVHCAEQGYPLLGDAVYGKKPKDPLLSQAHDAIGRQALHAVELGFVHPIRKEKLFFQSEPPQDFKRALTLLRTTGRGS